MAVTLSATEFQALLTPGITAYTVANYSASMTVSYTELFGEPDEMQSLFDISDEAHGRAEA